MKSEKNLPNEENYAKSSRICLFYTVKLMHFFLMFFSAKNFDDVKENRVKKDDENNQNHSEICSFVNN
jgi:hypothetical protein